MCYTTLEEKFFRHPDHALRLPDGFPFINTHNFEELKLQLQYALQKKIFRDLNSLRTPDSRAINFSFDTW